MAWECGLDSPCSRQGPVAGSCEHGDEPCVPQKAANFSSSWYLLTSQNNQCSIVTANAWTAHERVKYYCVVNFNPRQSYTAWYKWK